MTRLPDDRDMEQAVRSWMRDEEHPADRNRQVGRIMGRVDETRQRRGPWRFLPFWRGSRAVDEADADLVAAGRGNVAPSLMAVVAVLALVATGFVFLMARPADEPVAPGASPSPSPSTSPQPTMDPVDQELFARFEGVWSGERTHLDDVLEVYAEDAIHTVLWQDSVERFEGHGELLARIQTSRNVDGDDWVPLPDADTGEHRYLAVTENLGGIACVYWVRDARITRHDCILPMSETTGSVLTPGAPPDGISRDAIRDLMAKAWRGDREAFDAAVSPDIVHYVAFDNHAVPHRGSRLYWDVANPGDELGQTAPQALAAPIDLPAPEGEMRWTDFSDVGGGTLCIFWSRGEQVIRHDCIVPTSVGSNPPPATPEPSGT